MKNNFLAKTYFGLSSIVVLHFLILFYHSYNIGTDNIFFQSDVMQRKAKEVETKTGVFNLTAQDIKWIDSTLTVMPLYEKCAQVFMPAVFGRNLDTSSLEFKNTLSLVRDHGIGGIVISAGGIEETALMIKELQKYAAIPLLVSADFENGVGMRIDSANVFPHNMAIGATNNSDYAYKIGKAIATEALMLGVNINFAPVADINNNSENPVINLRSFSEDKKTVYQYCSKFIQGSKDGGIIATAKHFPGHGNTTIDSHKDLPVISGSKEYLFNNELFPFIKLINDNVQAIMIGHLSVPAYEPGTQLPSSLSYNIITKLLKEQLGFKGLIITDALDMRAVTNYYTDEETVLKAFKAGNDILLMPPNIKTGIQALYEAVKSGDISEIRLDGSVRKILAAKRFLKLYNKKFETKESLSEQLQIKQHKELSKNIAENSVTIVKMNHSLFPINPKNYSKVFLISITNRKNTFDPIFNRIAENKFSILNSATFTSKSNYKNYLSGLNKAKNSDLIILSSYFSIGTNGNGRVISDNQFDFIKDILSLNKKVIFLSFKSPYVLSLFPEAENYVCTFSDVDVSQQAALDLLLGNIKPKGILPVSIPNTEFKIEYKWNPEI